MSERAGFLVLLLGLLAPALPARGEPERIRTIDRDRRTALTADREWPAWARAVAKMTWLRKDGRVGVGTAVLVAPTLAMTAHHCTRDWRGGAVLRFGFDGVAKRVLESRVAREVVAGSPAGDWAILRLDRAVESIAPLAPAETRLRRRDVTAILLAGYSCDEDLGRRGLLLTYDAKGRLEKVRAEDGRLLTDAVCYDGASGGPVLVKTKGDDEFRWTGLVSANINASSEKGFLTYGVSQELYRKALGRAVAAEKARAQPSSPDTKK